MKNKKIKNFYLFNFGKIESKKGSHIEVILSFVIFVGFLIFLYVIVEPAIRSPIDEEYLLSNLKNELIEYVTGEGGEGYSLTMIPTCVVSPVYTSYFGNCFRINESLNSLNALVKNNNQETRLYNNNYPNDFSIDCGDCGQENYIILFSEIYDPETEGICSKAILPTACYSLTALTPKKTILLSEVDKLKIDYGLSSERENLMNSLNIPEKNWFWFNLTDKDRIQLIAPDNKLTILESENIYSQEVPITYLNDEEDINVKDGFLTIQFW